ncbi:type 1 glutamine amidotransferase [Aliiroseovarius sp. CAU 1755]
MRIAILMTNTDESAFAQRHPKDGQKWQTLIGAKRPDWKFTVFSVKDDEFPQSPSEFDGWIVTGSPASVHDNAGWIVKLLDLIQRLEDARVPMFGACFGHQAIAMALGGQVDQNPDGWGFGSTEVEVCSHMPWLEVKRFWQYGAHIEQVTALPDGAQVVFRHAGCPIGGFVVGDHIFTTQNHPEMSHDFIAALIEELADDKPAAVIDAARKSLPKSADNGMFADWIVRFFEHDRSA